ncbi:alpha/beta hydrolase family protein [Streptomyces halobius]|uniref:Hydrolase n=1 Tax=Streptomyces halobius TaxID=2879846 RepID=A0ABY4M8T7_9ACTN|nr:hydrolase [Streptomyces halobius]UQA93817.1 hydrolase [Streptomyces halobius]
MGKVKARVVRRKGWAIGALAVAAALVAVPVGAQMAAGTGEPAASPGRGAASVGTPDADARTAPLTLPAPTGAHQVGTVSLHLLDRQRGDPWVAGQAHRELMVSVRYPARGVGREAEADAARAPGQYPVAPQLLPREAAAFDAWNSFFEHIPKGKVDWAATRTHAHQGAPVARHRGRLPVVLYSPGVGDPRSLGSSLCDELASRGYVVVAVDHTYEPPGVQFPDGPVARSVLPAEMARAQKTGRITELLKKVTAVRVADTRFVLDELEKWEKSEKREVRGKQEQRVRGGLPALPEGLRGALDLRSVGMFGQSAGGFTAVQTMHDDRRIKAAVNMDGVMGYTQRDDGPSNPSTVGLDGVDRPLLLMGKEGNTHHTVASWGAVWEHSKGWHRDLTLRGSGHAGYTDAASLIPQIARRLGLPRKAVTETVGTIDPGRAVAAERAYVSAFFDRWLRGRDGGLLDGPSARYPEIRFVR